MPGIEAGTFSELHIATLTRVGKDLGLRVEVMPAIESNLSLQVIAALPQSEYIDPHALFKAHQQLIIEAFERPTSEFTVDSRFTGNRENMTEYLQKPELRAEVEAGLELVLLMTQGGENPRYQAWGIKPQNKEA